MPVKKPRTAVNVRKFNLKWNLSLGCGTVSANVRNENDTQLNAVESLIWDSVRSFYLRSGDCDAHIVQFTCFSYRHFISFHFTLFTFSRFCVQHVCTSTEQFKVTHRNVLQSIWLKIFSAAAAAAHIFFFCHMISPLFSVQRVCISCDWFCSFLSGFSLFQNATAAIHSRIYTTHNKTQIKSIQQKTKKNVVIRKKRLETKLLFLVANISNAIIFGEYNMDVCAMCMRIF